MKCPIIPSSSHSQFPVTYTQIFSSELCSETSYICINFNPLQPSRYFTYYLPRLTFENSTRFSHCVYMFFCGSQKKYKRLPYTISSGFL